jgi:A/G-specific adenine glycosylase
VFDDLPPLTAHLSPLKKNVKHVLTHRILYADFYLWEVEERPSLPDGYIWIREADIQDYGVPRLIEIMLNEINA